jgi:hypothetical protein
MVEPGEGGDRAPSEPPDYTVYKSRPRLIDRIRKPDLSSLTGRLKRGGDGSAKPPKAPSDRPWWRTALKWFGIFVVGWILLSMLAFAISAQIQKGKLADGVDKTLHGNPFMLASPQTILVLGTDVRSGAFASADEAESKNCIEAITSGKGSDNNCHGNYRSDTIMLIRAGRGTFRKRRPSSSGPGRLIVTVGERLDRVVDVAVAGRDLVERDDPEHLRDLRAVGGDHVQRELAPVEPGGEVEQQPDAGAVDVGDLAQVDHQPERLVGDRVVDPVAEALGVGGVDLADDGRHRLARAHLETGVRELAHAAFASSSSGWPRRLISRTVVPASLGVTSTWSIAAFISSRPRPRSRPRAARHWPWSRTVTSIVSS